MGHLLWMFLLAVGISLATSCVETGGAGQTMAAAAKDPKLSKEEVAVRFLAAYIQGQKAVASRYATPLAINKIPWGRSSTEYLANYDDKMNLRFAGGSATPTFQEVNGRIIIADFDVHLRH